MKKALIIATAGGFVPKFENNNIGMLHGLGYELHYAADFNNRVYEFDDAYWTKHHITIHQIDFVKDIFDFRGNAKAFFALKELIKDLQPELVHCHNPIAAALARAAIGKKYKTKVIYTAHGFHFYKGAPPVSILYKFAERLLARYTDVLITINGEDYEAALKFRLKKGGRVVMIPGAGVDLDRFKQRPLESFKSSKESLMCDDGIYRIVSVGELNNNKNHKTAIRAVALLNNDKVRYDIYGVGPLEQELKALIVKLGLKDKVRLCGYCNDVAAMLQNMDCFVFPSLREGLGMAAVEAMASGIPVIALNQRGTRQYMSDGQNGFVCDNEPSAFAKKIDNMMRLPIEKLAVMSECARTTAEKFGQNHTIEIMRQVYNDVDLQIRSQGY